MTSAPASASPLASGSELPLLEGQERRDRVGPLAQDVGGLAHDLGAVEGGHLAPGAEALVGGFERAVEVALVGAWATVPISSPVAGLTTGIERPPAALVQLPSMNSRTSLYMWFSRNPLERRPPTPQLPSTT